MKTISKFPAIIFITALVLFAFAFTSCDDDTQETPMPSISSTEIIHVPFFVETETGELPSDPSQLLYENRMHQPVTTPDGRHLTWGEFATPQGSIALQCTDAGVEATLQLTGLIPNGVYTFWNVTFDAPGFNPGVEGMNIMGLGAAGKGDGSDNFFLASPDGKGSITFLSPGGNLSLQGDMEACPLTDNYELHVVGTYHIDSQSYGPIIGPDGTFAEQFAFIYVNN